MKYLGFDENSELHSFANPSSKYAGELEIKYKKCNQKGCIFLSNNLKSIWF